MKKNILIFTCTCLFFTSNSNKLLAQKASVDPELKRNSLFIEFGGQGKYTSLNIDRLFRIDKKVKSSFRFGLISNPFDRKNKFVFGVPISYNFIFGQKNHHLELGLGLTALYRSQKNITFYDKTYNQFGEQKINTLYGSQESFSVTLHPKIGYRYQKPTGGFFFQANISPALSGFYKAGSLKVNDINYRSPSTTFNLLEKNYGLLQSIGLSFGFTFK